MEIVYLKCHHGNLLKKSCQKCEEEKQKINIYKSTLIDQKDTRTPIYRECPNKLCFCTGACHEIIGYIYE